MLTYKNMKRNKIIKRRNTYTKINYKVKTFFDEVDFEIFFEKQAFYFGEEINFRLKSNLKFIFDAKSLNPSYNFSPLQ